MMSVFAYEERTLLFAILAELIKTHLFPAHGVTIMLGWVWSQCPLVPRQAPRPLLIEASGDQRVCTFWLYQLFANVSLLDI